MRLYFYRWILKALSEEMTDEELDQIITDIDTDGSGTVDYNGTHICVYAVSCYSITLALLLTIFDCCRVCQSNEWLIDEVSRSASGPTKSGADMNYTLSTDPYKKIFPSFLLCFLCYYG